MEKKPEKPKSDENLTEDEFFKVLKKVSRKTTSKDKNNKKSGN